MPYRILLIGGGSGGHVFPLVAIAKALREAVLERAQDVELIMLGEGKFFKEAAKREAAQSVNFKYHAIMAGKMRRYLAADSFWDLIKMPISFIQSLWHLYWIMPDAVFTKSGYASFFPVLAARLYFIPIYLHDSDAVPGVTSRILGKWAKRVFISFEGARKYFYEKKVVLVGNPVREGILNSNKEEALLFFRLSPVIPTLLISGGSQGAKNINDIVLQSIVQLSAKFQVIHQCGKENFQVVEAAVNQIIKEGKDAYGEQISSRYRVYPFFNDRELSLAYAMADVIVGRSGSGTLFEIAAMGKPGVVIPIKDSASNHQYYNAMDFAQYGGIVIEEDNLVPSIFVDQIAQAVEHKEELGQAIRGFAKPDAAKQIAEEILAGI